LIDRHNYFVFTPLLVEAGVGGLEPRHVVVPIRDFLKRCTFRMAEVLRVEPGNRSVRYRLIGDEAVQEMTFDHLVVAIGSVARRPNIPGLRDHAFELKSLADAIALRDRAVRM